MTTGVVRPARKIYSVGHAVAIDKTLFRRFLLAIIGGVAAFVVAASLATPSASADPGGADHNTQGASSTVGNGPGGSASGGRRHKPTSPAFHRKQSSAPSGATGGSHVSGQTGGAEKSATKPGRVGTSRTQPGAGARQGKAGQRPSRPAPGSKAPSNTSRVKTSSRPAGSATAESPLAR